MQIKRFTGCPVPLGALGVTEFQPGHALVAAGTGVVAVPRVQAVELQAASSKEASAMERLKFGSHHILWEAVPMVNAFTTEQLQLPEGARGLPWQRACLAQCCGAARCPLRQKPGCEGTE